MFFCKKKESLMRKSDKMSCLSLSFYTITAYHLRCLQQTSSAVGILSSSGLRPTHLKSDVETPPLTEVGIVLLVMPFVNTERWWFLRN